ncbi:MlaA family lipoprotein [soil metagenome]
MLATAAALCSLGFAAPAFAQTAGGASPSDQSRTGADPWEGLNRGFYRLNQGLDRLVRPGVVFYHHAVPTPARQGVHNALTNLTGPIVFINDMLQLRPKRAAVTLGRFVVNSTAGVGGFGEVGERVGLPYHGADFGQTLGRYGVGTGPYLYLPLLGPTTLRDIAGRGVDTVADPFNVVNYEGRASLGYARAIGGSIDARDQVDPLLKDIDRTATDPYVTTRSLYLQNRAAFVNGDAATANTVQALPDFGPEPAPDSRTTPRRTPSTPSSQDTPAR